MTPQPTIATLVDLGEITHDGMRANVFLRVAPGVSTPQNVPKTSSSRYTGSDKAPSDQRVKYGVISPLWAQGVLMTPMLLLGYDAEWNVPADGAGERDIISLQFATPVSEGLDLCYFIHIHGIRKTVAQVISLVVGDLYERGHPLVAEAMRTRTGRKCKAKKGAVAPVLEIGLIGHFSIVDWTTFRDRATRIREVDSLQRTLVTVKKPIELTVQGPRGKACPAKIHLRDSMLLAGPGSRSLDAVGTAVGIEKVELPDGYHKSDMRRFYRERPDEFMRYAVTDAIIPPRYMMMWLEIRAHIGVLGGGLPLTVAGEAVRMHVWLLKTAEARWRELFFGLEHHRESDGKGRGKMVWEINELRALTELQWVKGFMGGRNEAFAFGLFGNEDGVWHDIDLRNAYAVAMSLLPGIDYTRNPGQLDPGVLARGQVKLTHCAVLLVDFEFPEHTHYPCIPIRHPEKGLIFPLRGAGVYVPAPEVYLALEMGAKITLQVTAFVYHQQQSKPFFQGQKFAIDERAKYPKGSFKNEVFKLLCNGGYGKMGQGLSGKRAYSPRLDQTNDIPSSQITHPLYAAMCTSWVRALLSAVMVQLDSAGHKFLSVTTDGFLTTASAEDAEACDAYGFADFFRRGREALGLDGGLWEMKHLQTEVIEMKTRGNIGRGSVKGSKLALAKCGYKTDAEDVALAESLGGMHEVMARKFFDRTGPIDMEFVAFHPARDYVRKGVDAVTTVKYKRVSWEFDYKRVPLSDQSVDAVSTVDPTQKHVRYWTRPCQDMAEFLALRTHADELGVVVKTSADIKAVMTNHRSRDASHETGGRVRGGEARTWAITVLRGIRQRACDTLGPDPLPVSGPEILEAVNTSFGVSLTLTDYKNGGRKGRPARAVLTADSLPGLEKLGGLLAWFQPGDLLTDEARQALADKSPIPSRIARVV